MRTLTPGTTGHECNHPPGRGKARGFGDARLRAAGDTTVWQAGAERVVGDASGQPRSGRPRLVVAGSATRHTGRSATHRSCGLATKAPPPCDDRSPRASRSEEHTSELQSLMRISYAVFCLKKKKHNHNI